MLIVFGGLPGTGKTTLSGELALPLFIAPIRYRVDERLIRARPGAGRDGQRLATRR